MIRKLQVKFIAINMTMIAVMLCVIFGLVYHFTRANLEAESVSMMRSIAANPIHLGQPGDDSASLRLPYFTLELGPKGDLLAAGGGYYDLSDPEFLSAVIAESAAISGETGVLGEYDLRFCRASTPRGTVLVFADMSSERTTLTHLIQTLFAIGLCSFLIFLGLSILLSRWAVRPVGTAWLQQKQFVADASHELKTPLTVIMTNAELLQSCGYSPEEQLGFSRNIYTMSQQMRVLIERMLTLARSDAEQPAQPMSPFSLSRLVLDCAISFEGVFVEKGLMLESEVQPDIELRGSEQGLRQVVDILLDNAQKYSFPGGVTRIELAAGQSKCRLKVSNPGPEIPPEERKQIFRRFYRMDKARSRDGSFGLGLSIAERIVEQHRGRIWAESRSGINTFTVELHL